MTTVRARVAAPPAVRVRVTGGGGSDPTKLPLAGGELTGQVVGAPWEELTGEAIDGWPLYPFPNEEPHLPSFVLEDAAGYKIGLYAHRGHLMLAQLDEAGLTGNGPNMWIPFGTFGISLLGGMTVPTAVRFNNWPDGQGSTLHQYATGIQTGRGTSLWLVDDYTVGLFANNVEKLRFGPEGIRIGGPSGPMWLEGTGSPEGVKAAPVGSLYSRTDGGAGTSLYVKESGGSTSSGWVPK